MPTRETCHAFPHEILSFPCNFFLKNQSTEGNCTVFFLKPTKFRLDDENMNDNRIWLVVLTILKNMKVNGKDYPLYIMDKKMFETTNQECNFKGSKPTELGS